VFLEQVLLVILLKKTLALYRNRKFITEWLHSIHPLDVIMRERNPVHNLPRFFANIQFNIPSRSELTQHCYNDKIADDWLGHVPCTVSFMKIPPVAAEFSLADGRADGQTDMTKLSRFHNFAKAPTIKYFLASWVSINKGPAPWN
jgi:hypothetical protein